MAGDEDLPSLEDWGPYDEDFWVSGAASFLVPPPPPPPSLGSVCSGAHLYCDMEGGPMGSHFDKASFPALPVIAVCSSVILVALLVGSFLFWRHKSKVQNLLPTKNEQQGHMGDMGAANGVSYEDVLINHHPTRLPQGHTQNLMPLEIIDMKLGELGPPSITSMHHTTFYPNRDTGQVVGGGKPFHPVYEEVSQAPSADRSTTGKSYESDFDESGKLGGRSLTTSDDDFAEDEFSAAEGSGPCSTTSSIRGSTGGDLCKDPVSSDEGNVVDCDFSISNLPDMLPGNNSFNYPRKHIHPNTSSERPDKMRRNPMHSPHHNHSHNLTTYPLPDRTANMNLPSQRRMDSSTKNNKKQSNIPLTDTKKQYMSSHVPPASFAPKTNLMSMSNNGQWQNSHVLGDRMNYASENSPQENIYSTIDEDEMHDYPVAHPSLTSLTCSQHSSSPIKSVVPRSMPVHGGMSPLSQRNTENYGSSYGDIMPAYNSTPFT